MLLNESHVPLSPSQPKFCHLMTSVFVPCGWRKFSHFIFISYLMSFRLHFEIEYVVRFRLKSLYPRLKSPPFKSPQLFRANKSSIRGTKVSHDRKKHFWVHIKVSSSTFEFFILCRCICKIVFIEIWMLVLLTNDAC